MSSGKVKCTCGWSWNKSDSSKKDMYICHECGRDNSNNMKNGGWLDNYGDEENANNSSASLPEGYVGEGYDTTGRDYSPAWGGQFQMGGSLPGATGHMYARIGAPSNGKYAKKTLASAQDGKWLDKWKEDHPSIRSIRNDVMNRKIEEHKGKGKETNIIQKENTKTVTPKEIKKLSGKQQNELAQRQSEEQARKDQVFESMQEAYKSPLMSPGYFTPEGMAIGAIQGATKLGPDLYEGNYKEAALDALMVLPEAGNIAKALGPSKGLLSHTYKLNPLAERLNDANKSYRVAGLDAFEDFNKTGVLRSQRILPENATFLDRVNARTTGFPSFQKGYADLNYLPEEGGVIFETALPTFKRGQTNPVTGNVITGRHYAHRAIDPETGKVLTEIPASDVKVFGDKPHWLEGYKEVSKKEDGGVIKDDRGQWDHPGEVTEINSNEITMKPDPATGKKLTRPVVGVSDTGDVKFMKPGKDYKFKGTRVTEYPVAQDGSFVDKLKAETAERKKNVSKRETKTTTNDNIPNASKMSAKGDEKLAKGVKYEKQKRAKELKEWNALSKDQQERILYDQRNQERGSISQYNPQSTSSKVWDIATHPMTAAGYVSRNEDIPNNFTKGDINAFESTVDIVNPFFYMNEADKFGDNLYQGNFMDAGINALNLIPIGAELAPEIRAVGRELGTAAKESGQILSTLPKAKSIKEAMGAFAGLPIEGALPRMAPEELKIFRQAQEVAKLKATGKPISQQYKYALDQGIPEEHLQKIFGKTKAEIESSMSTALENEARRATQQAGAIDLQRRPGSLAGSVQQLDRERFRAMMRGWDAEIDAGRSVQIPDSDVLRMPASSEGVAPIVSTREPQLSGDELDNLFAQLDEGNRRAQLQRSSPEYDAITDYGADDSGELLSRLDDGTLFNEGAWESFNRRNNFNYGPNRMDQLASKVTDPIKDVSSRLKRRAISSLQDYPYYEGPVMENVPHLFLRNEGSLRGVYNKVENEVTAGINSNDVFSGSLNTSHNSYLTQLKKGFKYKEGAPQYLGYKPMNSAGFLNEFDYSSDDIAKFLNTEIDEQVKRGFIPKNIQRPYVKNEQVMLPHYGIKQFKEGGNIRQEQKGLENLDQLTNFTNYNTKQPGGWLDNL